MSASTTFFTGNGRGEPSIAHHAGPSGRRRFRFLSPRRIIRSGRRPSRSPAAKRYTISATSSRTGTPISTIFDPRSRRARRASSSSTRTTRPARSIRRRSLSRSCRLPARTTLSSLPTRSTTVSSCRRAGHIALASLAPDLLTLCFNGLSNPTALRASASAGCVSPVIKSHAKGIYRGAGIFLPKCAFAPTFRHRASSDLSRRLSVGGRISAPADVFYEQRELIWKTPQLHPRLERCQAESGVYIFPKVDTKKFNIHSDEQMALDLLKEQKILITAGTGFNWGEPDHFPHRLPARTSFRLRRPPCVLKNSSAATGRRINLP